MHVLGYSFGKQGWPVYDLETRQFYQSRDVIFFEHICPYQHQSSAYFPGNAELPVFDTPAENPQNTCPKNK